MRIKLLLSILLFCTTACLNAQNSTDAYHLLIGTYADGENPNGIHVYRFDVQTGEFSRTRSVTELRNASYLTISKDRKNVYAVSGGAVNAFAFDSGSGKLDYLNSVPTQGSCYVSVDSNKKVVFTGNYGGGNVVAVALDTAGAFIEKSTQIVQHSGSSIVKERQEAPHVHAAVFSPDERYLLVPDLGTDRVYQYEVNTGQSELIVPAREPYFSADAGGGPRHLAIHPNGKYAYLVLELQGAVMALDYEDGKLTTKQTLSMTGSGFKGRVSGADIHVSPDGKFVYASNRGDANEIAIYSIGKKGKLKFVSRQSVLGRTPRNFAIDPSGNFLLAANQDTNEVIIFKRNKETGLLTPTGKKIEVAKPVCLKFTTLDDVSEDEQMITDALARFNVAMVQPDSLVLESLASDDLEYVHSSGTVRDKQGFIDEFMKRWTNFTKVEVVNQTITISGDNAIVRHRLLADMDKPGYPAKIDIIILMVWRKEDGRWKMLARQAAKIPD